MTGEARCRHVRRIMTPASCAKAYRRRRLSAALSEHELWLRKGEVALLHQSRRRVEIGSTLGHLKIKRSSR